MFENKDHKPNSRIRKELVFYLIVAVVTLAVAMGVGISITGSLYGETDGILRGRFSSESQLAGIYLQIYFGTLSLMLFANFIPGLVILRLPYRVYVGVMGGLLAGFLLGLALCMYYLIQPQATYIDHATHQGLGDPVTVTSGGLFFVGFVFLAGLCMSILGALLLANSKAHRDAKHRLKRESQPPEVTSGKDVIFPSHISGKFLALLQYAKESWFVQVTYLILTRRRRALGFIVINILLG